MHDATTLGELVNHGVQALRTYCDECGRFEVTPVKSLLESHGSYFSPRRIACEACGGDDLYVAPRMTGR